MNRIFIGILTLLVYGQVLYSQNEVRDMNFIKNNPNYIYATGTSMTSMEEASQNVKDLLNAEIEDWLIKNIGTDIAGYIGKSQEQLGFIKTQRGKLFRVFAYVNKVNILPYYKDETVITGDFKEEEENNVESEKTDTKNSEQDTTITQSSIEKQEVIIDNATKSEKETIDVSKYIPNEKERVLLNIKTFIELNEYINNAREKDEIVQVGKYSTLPTDGLVYVFIHNREGQIPACIKNENGHSINLLTGKVDQITSYKGCGAIWILFK